MMDRAEIVVVPVSTVEIVILPYNMIRFGITEVVLFIPGIIRKTKNSSFKNEKSKKEVDVAITVSNKDIV